MGDLFNALEVQRVFAMPLRAFLGGSEHRHSSRRATWTVGGGQAIQYTLHYFEGPHDLTAWGLTAAILIQERLLPACQHQV